MNNRIEFLCEIVLLAIASTGCNPATPQTGMAPEPTQGISVPETPTLENSAIQNSYNPLMGDESLIRGQAYVDSVKLSESSNTSTRELVFNGSLPTPCSQLRLNIMSLTADNHFNIQAYSVSKPDEMCAQVIQDFEAVVTMTGLQPGDYILSVNEKVMLTFTIPSGGPVTPPAEPFTSIVQDILSNPANYLGQQVIVVGYYRGWNLLGEASGQSPITRSDWVIKDNSGAIYVSAGGDLPGISNLVPGSLKDTTKVLRLTGVVRQTKAGQPYIEPTRVELVP